MKVLHNLLKWVTAPVDRKTMERIDAKETIDVYHLSDVTKWTISEVEDWYMPFRVVGNMEIAMNRIYGEMGKERYERWCKLKDGIPCTIDGSMLVSAVSAKTAKVDG